MSDNKFDKIIADQLNHLEMPYEPASWDLLASKLDNLAAPQTPPPAETPQPGVNSAQFDQRMKSMLEEVEMPYQSAHWEKMMGQLERAGTERFIRRYKISEAAAVLLFALAFQAALNSDSTWFRMPRPQQQQEPIEQRNDRAARTPKHRSNTDSGTIASSVMAPAALPTLQLQVVLGNNGTQLNQQTSHTGTSSDTKDKLTAALVIANNGIAPSPATLNAALLDVNGQSVVQSKSMRPLTLLAALSIEGVPTIPPHRPDMAGLATQPTKHRQTKPGNTYLMAYGGAERQNYAASNDYQTAYAAANVGLRVGKRNRNGWGIEAGVEHTPLVFRPEASTVSFHKDNNRVIASKYDKVRANVVSVPANVTRQIAKVGKTSLHAVAGVAAHFAANKTYEYQEVVVQSGPSGQTLTNKPTLPEDKGIFEGSALYGNSYASINGGLRLEHRVGHRYAAFIEPQVRRQIGGRGVGPNRSATNTVGVQAGVVAML
jgi:hypothetical protein